MLMAVTLVLEQAAVFAQVRAVIVGGAVPFDRAIAVTAGLAQRAVVGGSMFGGGGHVRLSSFDEKRLT
jgi:hypothetical protein